MEEVSSSPMDTLSSKEKEPLTKIAITNASNELGNEGVVEGDGDCAVLGIHGRKLTLVVWQHFDQVMVNGESKAKSKGCKKLFVGGGKSGTTHLKDHAIRCVKTKNTLDVKQQLLKGSTSRSGPSVDTYFCPL
ncbi:Erythronate-4-phosphate dehydrogenase [Bienertia sinuspersici]